MAQEKLTLAQRYELAQNELQQLASIITRIDERLEIFMKNHEKLDTQLQDHIQYCPIKKEFNCVLQRIATLEAQDQDKLRTEVHRDIDGIGEEVGAIYGDIEKVKEKQKELELTFKEIETNSKNHDGRWRVIGNFAFQATMSLIWVLVALALYHFGIPTPPTKP
jgi:chromosome segregation ATPase